MAEFLDAAPAIACERCEHRGSDWEYKTYCVAGVQDAGFPPGPTFGCAYFKEVDHV